MPYSYVGLATSTQYRNLTADDLVLARALERRGAKVVSVVWTEVAPESLTCDLLIIRSVWDYHLQPESFSRWLEAAATRMKVVNVPELVRWNMDKHYLKDIEAAGFAIPKTFIFEQGAQADLSEVMTSAGIPAAVIKPAISASAFETYRIDAAQAGDFNSRFNSLLEERAMIVQEFVPEITSGGEWSLVFIGKILIGKSFVESASAANPSAESAGGPEFTHAVNKLPRSGDFRVQEEHGGLHRLANPPAEALQMAQAILSRFAPQAAYCRADMVMRPQGPVLMELELIEPLLHFELAPQAAEKLAEILCPA